jgi:hypothetical protein
VIEDVTDNDCRITFTKLVMEACQMEVCVRKRRLAGVSRTGPAPRSTSVPLENFEVFETSIVDRNVAVLQHGAFNVSGNTFCSFLQMSLW